LRSAAFCACEQDIKTSCLYSEECVKLSDLIAVKYKAPDQRNTKTDQDETTDTIDEMNIFWCEPVTDLSGE
jgi:hypothetical protein